MANIITYDVNEAVSHEVVKADTDLKNKFNDMEVAQYARAVSSIIIYKSNVIDGIKFLYADELEGEIHGSSGNISDKFSLREDEYIIYISWSTVNYNGEQIINRIYFKTNLNSEFETHIKISDAAEKNYSYECKNLHSIVGLKGCASEHLNSITHVIVKEVPKYYEDEKYYYDDYFSIINAKKLTKICGYSGLVIDRLQFVYDNNDTMTIMHGKSRTGGPFEFVLDSDEYIKKIIWITAVVDFTDGYGKSPVLAQIEIHTNKGKTFKTGYFGQTLEDLGKYFQDNIHMTHRYTHEADNDEEIFCLAGVYSKFMGRITKIYKRKRTSRNALSEQQVNSDGKDILFVCHIHNNQKNDNYIDSAVKGLVDIMKAYHSMSYIKVHNLGFEKSQKARFAYLPANINTSINAEISSDDFTKALLSGQYKYISIYSHGSMNSCGNLGRKLVDIDWVKQYANEIKEKMSNTIMNFNCCECAFRGLDKIPEGLVREFIKAGVKAAFGYSISYLSISNYSRIDAEIQRAYRKIFNIIDDICVKNMDSKKPYELGQLVKNEMSSAIGKYGDYINDIRPFTDICKKLKSVCTKQNQLSLALGRDIITECKEEQKSYFTKNGSVKMSEGAFLVRDKVKSLFTISENEMDSTGYKFYSAYVDFLVNYEHLCGPDTKQANCNLKKENLGEFCNEFCNECSNSEL